MNEFSNKKLKFVKMVGDLRFYEYAPSLFEPYYFNYPKEDHPLYEKRLVHKIRMMLEFLQGGYRVFYMVKELEIVGHIVVTNGGRRLTVSKKEDIVLGPIFISPRFRGQGLGTIGINAVLNQLNLDYQYAYEFIKNNNIASIRTVEKNGYIFICYAKEKGLLKKLVPCSDGDFSIYQYSSPK